MRIWVYSLMYTVGIQLFGWAMQLPWVAGFGIYLSGLAAISLIVHVIGEEL